MAVEPQTLQACRSFHELSLADADWAGGKGANLGEMTGIGLAVPSGFVIGAPAYAAFCDGTGLRERLRERLQDLDPEDPEQLAAVAEVTHSLSETTGVPYSLATQIVTAYDRLRSSSPDLPVSVRSSAIGEDMGDSSFAGMHSTFLGVRGERELLTAVRKCWASLYSERTIYYRATRGLPLAEMDIAVVVQKQLAAKRSGVMFTLDPASGNRDRVVIEASIGLGEAIVSGAVSPDRFVFSKPADSSEYSPTLIEKRINRKEVAVEALPEGGTAERRLDRFAATHSAILESEAAQIAHVGLQIERHYGEPQDIEWALDQAGALWILQSRPVTATGQAAAATPEGATGGVLLTGVGAGPGSAIGAVRIIESFKQAGQLRDGELLVAHTTRPDWVPLMRRAGGIITDSGGITCHAAIVARELAIPTIVGTGNATTTLTDGQVVTIDAGTGEVLAGARRDTGAARARPATDLPATVGGPAPAPEDGPQPQTKTKTKILLNLSDPGQVAQAAAMDVDGVGLLRAEILVVHALDGQHPQLLVERGRGAEFTDRMAEQLIRFAEAFAPRPVTYRTIDFRSNEFRELEGGEKFEPVEDNPMIGMRGVQRYLRDPKFFALELEAIHRVHEAGLNNLQMMLPFVRSGGELARALDLIDRAGLSALPDFRLWVMAEVPSVIYFLDQMVDLGVYGISVGTNDLTQLLLGADRESAALAESFDARDPAVVAYLKDLLPKASGLGLATSICGQAPSVYPEYAELLVRSGIGSISVSMDAVAQTRVNVAAAEAAGDGPRPPAT